MRCGGGDSAKWGRGDINETAFRLVLQLRARSLGGYPPYAE
jgi:hypothetical protein